MPLTVSDVEFLRELVMRQSGNILRTTQSAVIESRLTPVVQDFHLGNVEQLVAELRRTHSPRLSNHVAQAVTINETSFFRDVPPFNALRTTIIPDVLRRNAARRDLRIWSAAVSSGQEAYTIAMVLREHFPQLSDWYVRLLATDLSEKMLARCRSGEYSQLEVNRGLPARNLLQFFDRVGSNWKVKPELRSLIDFRQLNLMTAWPLVGAFDVIFIRNVLIYFDQQARADILGRALKLLHPDGYLFIGSAETLIGLDLPLKREEIDGTVCYRHFRD